MRIVQLHAENFKRLGVVEITPEGHLVTIGGKNGHGKSSVLDAIYVALKGRAVAPPKPIRAGEEKCTIRLDLGDLVITRNFHEQEGKTYTDTIKVEDGEGRRYSKPQEVLNALLGEVGFDPFEFVNLKPKEQASRLLEMVPLSIDLDDFREADASDTLNRRDLNRDAARLKAQIDGIPKEEVPGEVPDRAALTEALGNAANTNAEISREEQRREAERTRISGGRGQVQQMNDQAAKLRAEADDLEARATELSGKIDAAEKALDDLPALDEFVDTDEIRVKLREAEGVEALVERQNRRAALIAELEGIEKRVSDLNEALATRARERNEALAAAEMPVAGLGFAIGEDGSASLTYEGLPFDKDQISTAVQLRVSTAIGMATNPRLRVLRIMDGSLLDEDSMKMLAEMAEAEDFQLWVEVVGDGGVGIVMENGLVRGTGNQDDSPAEAQAEAPAEEKPKAKAKAAPKADEGKLL